jgi:hypothetical protein
MDGYSVVNRLHEQDTSPFFLNQTIKSYSLPHGRPNDWDTYNLNKGELYFKHTTDMQARDRWPNVKCLLTKI